MEEQHFYTYIDSPVGFLKLISTKKALVEISFSDHSEKNSAFQPEIIKDSEKQLKEYFDGIRFTFELNLDPPGTSFQQKVWKHVQNVPFGQTATYLEIARLTGSSKNTRAVGLANGKNPIPLVIPCHRIIGSNGKLTGYAGGLDRKKWLLLHELKLSKPKFQLF